MPCLLVRLHVPKRLCEKPSKSRGNNFRGKNTEDKYTVRAKNICDHMRVLLGKVRSGVANVQPY